MPHRMITNMELRAVLGTSQAVAHAIWQRLQAGERITYGADEYHYVGYGVIQVTLVPPAQQKKD